MSRRPDGKRNVMLPGSAGRTRVELLLCAATAGSPGSAGARGTREAGLPATFHAPRLGNLPVEKWCGRLPRRPACNRAKPRRTADVLRLPPSRRLPRTRAPAAARLHRPAWWRSRQKLAQRCGGESATNSNAASMSYVNFTATSSPAWHAAIGKRSRISRRDRRRAVVLLRGAGKLARRPPAPVRRRRGNRLVAVGLTRRLGRRSCWRYCSINWRGGAGFSGDPQAGSPRAAARERFDAAKFAEDREGCRGEHGLCKCPSVPVFHCRVVVLHMRTFASPPGGHPLGQERLPALAQRPYGPSSFA